MNDLKCDGPDCKHQAEFAPQLILQVYRGGAKFTADMSLNLCRKCSDKDHLENYTNEGKWERICELFKDSGIDKPKLELTELKHVPLWKVGRGSKFLEL